MSLSVLVFVIDKLWTTFNISINTRSEFKIWVSLLKPVTLNITLFPWLHIVVMFMRNASYKCMQSSYRIESLQFDLVRDKWQVDQVLDGDPIGHKKGTL